MCGFHSYVTKLFGTSQSQGLRAVYLSTYKYDSLKRYLGSRPFNMLCGFQANCSVKAQVPHL